MEALKMVPETNNWNDDRLDELSRRVDNGFKQVNARLDRTATREDLRALQTATREEMQFLASRVDKLTNTLLVIGGGLIATLIAALIAG
ncbi:MAG TPA: hypothetical protein VFP21_07205 [Solirubrobacterales bacterium]|nr:hypothetical protein [Solirubrobacterales bacterium]